MARLSISELILMAFAIVAAPGQTRAADSGRTLVLFGASWCAPCVAELRRMGSLSAAATPGDRIVIAWDDSSIESMRFDRPANVEVASVQRAQRLRAVYAGDIAGYPYAVMLDVRGQPCSRWSRAVTREAMDAMRSECERSAR